MKATKKPVVIDYFPLVGEVPEIGPHPDYLQLKSWVESFGDKYDKHFTEGVGKIQVLTLEGTSYNVTNKDVIIRGIKGEYYPCKKDIFEQTYDL